MTEQPTAPRAEQSIRNEYYNLGFEDGQKAAREAAASNLDEALATERRLTVERMVERYGLPGTADSIEDVQRDLATADVDEEAKP